MKNIWTTLNQERKYLILASRQDQWNLMKQSSETSLFFDVKWLDYRHSPSRVNNRYYFHMYDNYQYSYDMSQHILRYLDFIDVDKLYQSPRLRDWKAIKLDLIQQKIYQQFNSDVMNDRVLIQVNGMPVPGYLFSQTTKLSVERRFDTKATLLIASQRIDSAKATYDEITRLLDLGVDINQIKIVNADAKDEYYLSKYLSDSDIPYASDLRRSLVEYPEISNFMKYASENGYRQARENLLKGMSPDIREDLVRVLNRYLDSDLEQYTEVLLDMLQHSYSTPRRYRDCIEFVQFNQATWNENHFYLVMNYSDLDIVPVIKRYPLLTKEEIQEIGYFDIDLVNNYEKRQIENRLNSMKNLWLCHAEHTDRDNMIPDLNLSHGLDKVYFNKSVNQYSHLKTLNRLEYAKARYDFERYYLKHPDYELLHNTFHETHRIHHHQYTGIYTSDLNHLLSEYNSLTGAKMESYKKCQFQFLLRNLLKLDTFEDNVYQFLGTLTHKVLEMTTKNGSIEYEKIVNQYADFPEDESYKETLFRTALKRELDIIIPIFLDFHDNSKFNDIHTEWSFDVSYRNFHLTGIIDKLMIYNTSADKKCYVIVDYKMNEKDLKLEDIQKGLSLQLPFYLMIFHQLGTEDKKYVTIPTGMFYQQTSLGRYQKGDTVIKKQFQLKGLALNSVKLMEMLDPGFIHLAGISTKLDGDFKSSNRLLTVEKMIEIIHTTRTLVDEIIDALEQGKFHINPIPSYGKRKDSVSCEYCSFNSICYNKNKGLGGDSE